MSVALAEPNPRAVTGDNNPPADPFAAVKAHMDDLLVEAHAWADGTTVENHAQADEASRLIDDLNKAAKAAEEQRVVEKTPFDESIAEIQGRYNAYIADRKNKAPGRIWKAVDALKACVKPYLDKLEADRLAAVAEAKRVADEAAAVAAKAAREAASSDLAAQEAAEELVITAQQLGADAKRIENSRTQARGGDRALGLKATFTARLDDPRAVLLHYWATNRDPLIAVLQIMAQADVDRKVRTIPGVFVVEGTKL